MAAPKGNTHNQKGKEARSVNLNIRIEPWRRDEWKRKAAEHNMTMTDWILVNIER